MINLVKKFLNGERTEQEGNSPDTNQDIRIATCALLLEIANSDGEFSESEKNSITEYLKKDFNLSDDETDNFIKLSQAKAGDSIDLWQFTRLINRSYTIEEKVGIIEAIWKIAYADGVLDKHEDYLIHKLADLLHLTHKQLIDAKLKIKHENIS